MLTSQNTPQNAANTQGYIFNHTMLRVKDIAVSLAFYTDVLGFRLIDQRDHVDFSLYFLALLPESITIPSDRVQRRTWIAGLNGVLELTHNHGTERQLGRVYHNGNVDPRGFGHICISVPDIHAACQRFESLQVTFQKRLSDGQMKDIAFIQDPDHYWIEIIGQ